MSFGPPACEGGHGTDQGRSRGREGDKVFALCSHIGRGFSPDPCGVSRELLLSSSPLFLQYLSDVRTEGVGGRSGMGAPAVVCFTTLTCPHTDKTPSRPLRRKPCRLPPDEEVCTLCQTAGTASVCICPGGLLRSDRPGCSVLPFSESRI